jgi:hypothetical protein
MKLIFHNFPPGDMDCDGNVVFYLDGYCYNIGEIDGIPWISRMTIEDHENDVDNWEKVSSWVPENKPVFRLLRGDKLSE